MIIPSPCKEENRPAERVKMTWFPVSNVVGLDSLKFLHVACGLESRIGQGRTRPNLTGMEGRSRSFLPSIASEETRLGQTGMEALKPDDDRGRNETCGLKRSIRLVTLLLSRDKIGMMGGTGRWCANLLRIYHCDVLIGHSDS